MDTSWLDFDNECPMKFVFTKFIKDVLLLIIDKLDY